MPYTVSELPGSGILVLTSTGRVTDQETRDALVDVKNHSERTGPIYLLSDVSAAEVAITLPRTYNTAREKTSAMGPVHFAQALVFRMDQADFATFWENTNVNAGITARAFTDRSLAIAWLEAQQPG